MESSGPAGGVYGDNPEITVLEVLVHLNGVLSAPLVLCGYDVPDTPGLIAEADGQASATYCGDWLRAGKQLGLLLPSVLVHQETFQLDQRLG